MRNLKTTSSKGNPWQTVASVLFTLTLLLGACQSKQQQPAEKPSCIDSTLQVAVQQILQREMEEIDAYAGQAIVMETTTGWIKAWVGLEKPEGNAEYQLCSESIGQQPSGLMRGVSFLAALNTGKVKLSDPVDVGNGIYPIGSDTLKDHNWHRGGYGEITQKQGIASSSNIALAKALEVAFGQQAEAFCNSLNRMGYGKPDSIKGIAGLKPSWRITPRSKEWNEASLAWLGTGYEQLIAPVQMLTFYNAIANGGKMLQPLLYQEEPVVLQPQIAGQAEIDSLKSAMQYAVAEGLCKPAWSEKVGTAGLAGTAVLSEVGTAATESDYAVQFCGYFPAEHPRYTLIVSMNKRGLPASGGLMAGKVFRQIAELLLS